MASKQSLSENDRDLEFARRLNCAQPVEQWQEVDDPLFPHLKSYFRAKHESNKVLLVSKTRSWSAIQHSCFGSTARTKKSLQRLHDIRRFTMKNKKRLGIALSFIGILTGLLLFYLLAENYMTVVEGKIAGGRPDEAIAVEITHSMLGALGIAASALWAAVLYGFSKMKDWSWQWGSMAASLQILAGFFPVIPAKSIDLPAATMPVFIIAALLWFGIMYVGRVNGRVILLLLVGGMAYVLTYINGVAVISRYQHLGFETAIPDVLKGMYAVIQLTFWMGAAAWLVFNFAVIKHKSWAVPLGVMAAFLSMIGGYTLSFVELSIKGGVFSLYLPAAIVATGLLIYLLRPASSRFIQEWQQG